MLGDIGGVMGLILGLNIFDFIMSSCRAAKQYGAFCRTLRKLKYRSSATKSEGHQVCPSDLQHRKIVFEMTL